jgi:hypothetical protein
MPHALAREPRADADLVHQVDRALLEHAGADALDDVLLAPVVDDYGIDAALVQQVAEHEAGGAGPDNADLGALQGT